MALKYLLSYFYLSSFRKDGEKETKDWSLPDIEHVKEK